MKAMLSLALTLLFAAACGDDGSAPKDAAPDDAVTDGGSTDADCFTNPQTHDEIINACTTAQKVYKNPTLPLTLPDGGLAPLPPPP